MRSPEELVVFFRESGRKVTPQREYIFRILQNNQTHPTAELIHAEVVKQMPSVSLKTVYQTLHELEDMGEISGLDLGTGSVRFDPNQSLHHHLVCSNCYMVADIYLDIDSLHLPEQLAQGFEVGDAEVTFRGLCRDCKRLENQV